MRKHTHASPSPGGQARASQFLPTWMGIIVWLGTTLSLLVGIYVKFVWPRISRWGASDEVVNKQLPGDELVPNPILVTTKAITIQATPQEVWPWLVQLGVDRGGMYSYLWVENLLLHLDVSNADNIHPEWQNLRVGDFIRFTPKDFALNPGPGLYVQVLQSNIALAGCFGLEDEPVDCGQAPTWQFVLEPQASRVTRLILRSRTPGTPTKTTILGSKIAYLFQFYMERKMLLGLKTRVEAHTTSLIEPTIVQ